MPQQETVFIKFNLNGSGSPVWNVQPPSVTVTEDEALISFVIDKDSQPNTTYSVAVVSPLPRVGNFGNNSGDPAPLPIINDVTATTTHPYFVIANVELDGSRHEFHDPEIVLEPPHP
jgi:hypothetical protein